MLPNSLPQMFISTFQLFMKGLKEWSLSWHLWRVRKKNWAQKGGSSTQFLNYTVRMTDGPNFYMQYKDEFIRRIYRFEAERPNPLILDGGSNIGMSILYFKHVYPEARVIGFEPDPHIFGILQENIAQNHLKYVTLINAGLSAQSGPVAFVPDGGAGGRLGRKENSIEVETRPLSDYLAEPVDFMKLNIEGEELPVLQEAEANGKLRNIREMVIEYHGWPQEEQRLGALLDLLDRNGFRYLIDNFDNETCSVTKPPFHLPLDAPWFCLVYGRRT